MLARYRHVIWDWNGTLLDDLDICVEVMNGLLERHGLALLDRARYHATFDFPVREYYRRLGLEVADGEFERHSRAFIAGYEARRLDAVLQPGADAILAAVLHAGLTQSILSAYHHDTLQEVVAHFGIAGRFVRLTGLDNIHAHGKIELGRAWVEELALPRAEVLLVGDTLHDLEVGQALGIDCVLVSHGHHSAERLRARHNRVYENLSMLLVAFQSPEVSTTN
jgi:phosphoglycolate phosphatase